MTTIWVYIFEDGTKLELLESGLSVAEVYKLKELHGECELRTRHIRGGGEKE